jgi:hypothetical protein
MPRGIPKNKEGISKMEGMRRAMAELGNDAAPMELQKFLKDELGIAMPTSLISNYKSTIKSSGRSALIRKPGAAKPRADGITVEDIRTVKEVIDKLGAEKVRELADVLGK